MAVVVVVVPPWNRPVLNDYLRARMVRVLPREGPSAKQ